MRERAVLWVSGLVFFVALLGTGASAFAMTLEETVQGYLRAETGGDVAALKAYVAGPLAEKYRTLLENNSDYGNFLKNFYYNATYRITGIAKNIVTIEYEYPDGNIFPAKIQVEEQSAGNWRVVKRMDPQ